LGGSPRFSIRFDVPSRCADLLHAGEIDVGLIPSIEYARGRGPYAVVPGVAIASRGPVASVAIYTTKAIGDVRTLALDTSSRSSVALARVLCAKAFHIEPSFRAESPNLERMLSSSDAALIIGDIALFLDRGVVLRGGKTVAVEKIDLGDVWTKTTGLPFVYAFWAGRPQAMHREDVDELLSAKRKGLAHPLEIAQEYFRDAPSRSEAGVRYLRDNIKYDFGDDERAGVELFYRYAAEVGVIEQPRALEFY
jgi:chorismate dehydratase